jgi:hypothetical protein
VALNIKVVQSYLFALLLIKKILQLAMQTHGRGLMLMTVENIFPL